MQSRIPRGAGKRAGLSSVRGGGPILGDAALRLAQPPTPPPERGPPPPAPVARACRRGRPAAAPGPPSDCRCHCWSCRFPPSVSGVVLEEGRAGVWMRSRPAAFSGGTRQYSAHEAVQLTPSHVVHWHSSLDIRHQSSAAFHRPSPSPVTLPLTAHQAPTLQLHPTGRQSHPRRRILIPGGPPPL